MKAISFGQADAYIGYRGVVDHLIASNFLSDLRIVAEVDVPGLTPQGLHIGVRQELPLLHSCLQKAMQTIQDKQKVALAQKWISLDQSGFPPLNKEEKFFVKQQKSILDCLQAVSAEQVDAALSEKPVFDYLIRIHFLLDLQSIPITDNIHFANTPVSLGVSKDQPVLRDVLQKAMDVISEEELSTLQQRWLNPEDIHRQNRIRLSADERSFLARKQQIEMCVNTDWMPFERINAQGRPEGIAAEIIKEISDKIGVPVRVVPSKGWQESRRLLKTGKCDIHFLVFL